LRLLEGEKMAGENPVPLEELKERGYYLVEEVALKLNTGPRSVRQYFRAWLKRNGIPRNKYFKLVKTNRKAEWRLIIPQRAVKYIAWRAKGFKDGDFKNGAITHHHTVTTATKLAAELCTTPRKLTREFKWWCWERGLDPADFYRPGIGYNLPAKFVEHARKVFGGECGA